MVGSMDRTFTVHAHQRSLSSLASTIMPCASNASPMTSVSPSPSELENARNLPIELKIPLPLSPSHSDDDSRQNEEDGRGSVNLQSSECEMAKSDDGHITFQDEKSSNHENDHEHEIPPGEDPTAPRISLEELASLAQEEEYERKCTASVLAQVERLSLANAIDRRLKDTLSIAYGNMIDQYKGDDQAGFTGLFEASERLVAHCKQQDPDPPFTHPSNFREERFTARRSSPVYSLPQESQDSVVAFISRVRTELDYLADLISSLPSPELTALTSSYHPAGVEISVLPNHSHGRTDEYSRDSQMMKLSRRMDAIDRFHTQDPYFTLLYGVFDSSSPIGSREYNLKTEIWARTCARVITNRESGSEEFAIATIDAFVDTTKWTLKQDIELYIFQALSEGAFLLDPPIEFMPEKPGSLEPSRAGHAIAEAQFFDKYTRGLFTMLTAESPFDAVPQGVLAFIHTTLRHIADPQTRELARKFIVSRWYFGCFLSSVLEYPEVHGMALNHHIGQSARKQILHELVLRLQSQMFAVLAPSSSILFVLPEVQRLIFKMIEYFDSPRSPDTAPLDTLEDQKRPPQQLMLSHWDIIGVIEALHPVERQTPLAAMPLASGHPSSSTSTATLCPSPDGGSHEKALSTTPSYTGSSLTGGTLIGEPAAIDEKVGQGLKVGKGNLAHKDILTIDSHPGHQGASTQCLSTVCVRLRELSKVSTERNNGFPPREWAFFDISPEKTSLRLSHGASEFPPLISQNSSGPTSPRIFSAPSKEIMLLSQALQTLAVLPNGLPMTIEAGIASPASLQEKMRDSLQAQVTEAKWRHDFVGSHQWWLSLSAYSTLLHSAHGPELLQDLVNGIAQKLQQRLRNCISRNQDMEAVKRRLDHHGKSQAALDLLASQRRALRIKMWYISDVKNSSPYEDALRVIKALRTMATSRKGKQPAGLRDWYRKRLRGVNPYDRAEEQALDIMCAPKGRGGLTKLADEQIGLTSRWLEKNNIENFCKGEERLHRFCLEVQKSVNKLAGTNSTENAVLWSSHLFRKERASFGGMRHSTSLASFPSPLTPPSFRPHDSLPLRSPIRGFVPPLAASSSGPMPMDFSKGLQITTLPNPGRSPLANNFRYPHTALHPTQAFGHLSPPMTPLSPKVSDVLSGTLPNGIESISKPRIHFVEELKESLLGLILSDLGYLLWANGSETDVWIDHAAGQSHDEDLGEKPQITPRGPQSGGSPPRPDYPSPGIVSDVETSDPQCRTESTVDSPLHHAPPSDGFSYTEAYSKVLQRMSLSQDPYEKLRLLTQLEELVIISLGEKESTTLSPSSPPQDFSGLNKLDTNAHSTIPRTKATRLEEVIANCTERRANTMKRKQPRSPLPFPSLNAPDPSARIIGADRIVAALLAIFRSDNLRPSTLFRDLQYIAAFIPSSIIDQTAQGKAFWDISIAALALKQDMMDANIVRATEITTYHLTAKKPPQFPNADASSEVPSWLSNTTLRDAAQLWLTCAKEGSPIAARELALFYLTNPEMLRRVTMPFSEAKDVFGPNSHSGQTSSGALDPLTFSVILHWMNVAASGGDKEAKDFLRDNGAMGSH